MFKCPHCKEDISYVHGHWSIGGATDIDDKGRVKKNDADTDDGAVSEYPEEITCPECEEFLEVKKK